MNSKPGWGMKVLSAGLAVAMAWIGIPFAVFAEQAAEGGVLRLRAGKCTFKVLDSTGVKPISKAKLVLKSAEKDDLKFESIASKKGVSRMDVPAGKYVLTVNGTKMADMEFDDASKITECRIVMPGDKAAAALPGKKAAFVQWRYAFYGGVAVVTGVIMYDQVKDDDKDEGPASK